MYKLHKDNFGSVSIVIRFDANDNTTCIPFAPDNTDYARFKKEINADEAQLEDADGNLMTAKAAKAYVATLP